MTTTTAPATTEQPPPLLDQLAYAALQLVFAGDAGLPTHTERSLFDRLKAEHLAVLSSTGGGAQ